MTTISQVISTITAIIDSMSAIPVRGTASFNTDVQLFLNGIAGFVTDVNAMASALNTLKTELNTLSGQINTVSGEVASNASSAATDAGIAASYADSIIATSTTSVAIGTGSKTFTIESGKQFAAGMFVSVISTASSAKYMHGAVTSYSGTTLVVNVTDTGGSGTIASWAVGLSGSQGPATALPASFTLTPSPSTDHTASGLIASMTCGETITLGNLCYIKSDGLMWKTDADAAATMPGVAIALGTQSAGSATNFLFYGFFRDDSYAWTVGSLLYASGTAGAITATAPSGTTDIIQAVAIATHADRIFFNPSLVTAAVV